MSVQAGLTLSLAPLCGPRDTIMISRVRDLKNEGTTDVKKFCASLQFNLLLWRKL
jgi:hypothetical protein